MANVKISALPAVTTVVPGSDVLPLVSGGITTKATPNAIVQAVLPAPGDIGGTTAGKGTFSSVFASSASTSYPGSLTDGIMMDYTTGTGRITVGASDGFAVYNGGPSSRSFLFGSDSSGNVGIGTSSPSYKLDVAGVNARIINAGSTALTYLDVNNAYGTIRTGIDASGNGYLGTASNLPLNLVVGNAARATIDSSGNLGLGVTPSAWVGATALQVGSRSSFFQDSGTSACLAHNTYQASGVNKYINSVAASMYTQGSGTHAWYTAPSGTAGNAISFTQAMTLDASGNLGIGTTTPGAVLHIKGSNGFFAQFLNSTGNTGEGVVIGSGSGLGRISSNGASTALTLEINGTERARIDSSGNLLVGTTSNPSGVRIKASGGIQADQTGSTTATGLEVDVGSNNTTQQAILVYSSANALTNFAVYSNGNAVNRNNSYGSISDAKLKENIVDATPKLDDVNRIRVVNFNMIGEAKKQIGVIAQEIEPIFPGMVDETNDLDKEGNDLGTVTKSVKYSVFVPILVKAIQELSAELNELKAKVNA